MTYCDCGGTGDVRVALLARAENRGLGAQSWEAFRHFRPAKTLVVQLAWKASPYEQHLERFPGAKVAQWNEDNGYQIDAELIDWVLTDVDVLFTAETPYSYNILEIARDRNVKTVVQGNHEFMRWIAERGLVRPDLFLAPTLWGTEAWPRPWMHLPFPVCRKRIPFRQRTEAKTFLHVIGHRAMLDRNGSRLVEQALPFLQNPTKLIVTSQLEWGQSGVVPHVEVDAREGDRLNYWDVYDDADVFVLPRRYGGQSLAWNEAAAAGLPVIALNGPPQNGFLPQRGLVEARVDRRALCQSGGMDLWSCHPNVLAAKMDELIQTPSLVQSLSRESGYFAQSISWETLGPRYRAVFEALTEGRDFLANPLEMVP